MMQTPDVVERAHGNIIYLEHPEPLRVLDPNLVAMLDRCCERHAGKTFLAERADGHWRSITFTEFRRRVQRVASALEKHGVASGTRVALLARNSIDHAIVNFAIVALGAVVVPLSPAYLAHEDGLALLKKLSLAAKASLLIHEDEVRLRGVDMPLLPLSRVSKWSAGKDDGVTLAERQQRIRPRDAAKIFFTSGSTGTPKVVVNTHAMLTSAAAMIDRVAARLPNEQQPLTVDWLPWTHTFGGNVNVHAALMQGKMLHIDAGTPLPGRFLTTVDNLREVRPTEFSSVPAAYPLLLDALERDDAFAGDFFGRVHTCSFGGAALSPSVVARFQALSVRTCGERIAFGGGYGMTEACGIIALVYWRTDRTDLLGLPPPGMQIKLVRIEAARWECRVRGANIFAGYEDAADVAMFDEEGYFVTGDAVEFASVGEPAKGLIFAGRIKEDFKLANGTWVRAGSLREALLDELRPLASDLVIAGENRNEVGVLVWLSHDGAGARQAVADRCREFNQGRSGATQRIQRMHICERPVDSNAGELTAKGTINVRRLLENRRDLVEQLYAGNQYRL